MNSGISLLLKKKKSKHARMVVHVCCVRETSSAVSTPKYRPWMLEIRMNFTFFSLSVFTACFQFAMRRK